MIKLYLRYVLLILFKKYLSSLKETQINMPDFKMKLRKK